MTLPFKQIACLDMETFYSDSYGLGKLDTTEYIRSPQFEAQTAALKLVGSEGRPHVWVGHEEIYRGLREIDWSVTACLAHHTNFDGLILTHHFGVFPCFWLDTMGMARFAFGVDSSASLAAVTEKMGRPGKVNKGALVNVKGKRLADFTPEELAHLRLYNGDDVEDTIFVYQGLSTIVPEDELKLIDITVRMYAEPTMLLDGKRLETLYHAELERKKGILERLAKPMAYTLEQEHARQEARHAAYEAKGKVYAKPRLSTNELVMKELASAEKFALHLEAAGVEPPQKISPRTGQPAYAFAKNDLEFKELLEHPSELVRDLVEGRLMAKSTIVESRAAKLMGRANYPTPIYLNYYGARTGRWSGGDGCNWQNPPRRGPGAEIRKALRAPQGTMMCIADASQIEARMNAWKAGQFDKLEVFARYDRKEGPDVYCYAAQGIYGRPIDAKRDPDERFVGKVLELSAGYGAGAPKINYMFRVGQFGPPVQQTLEETTAHLAGWRQTNHLIHAKHKVHERTAMLAFVGMREIEDGPVVFEGHRRGGYIHLPNGGYIYYPGLRQDEDGGMVYDSRNGPVRLWGGLITENIIQALSRVLLGQQMLRMQEEFPDMRIVMSTHDEVGLIIAKHRIEELAHRVKIIMSTPSAWAEGVPLNADVKVAAFYDKS